MHNHTTSIVKDIHANEEANQENALHVVARKVKTGVMRLDNIKNIIAVSAGKGGVGKSTVAANLAYTLANNFKLKIGLLDADIYGPSIPLLVGARDYQPAISDDNKFVPLEKFALKILSFGFLIKESKPAIWRGAIVIKALKQLLYDTAWGELDYLIVDMPPGTGDIQLSLCQTIPLTAAIIVTTPQTMALLDVIKSINMYNKLTIPCLGVVKNMNGYLCSHCGCQDELFRHNEDYDKMLLTYNLSALAAIPLHASLARASDAGTLLGSATISGASVTMPQVIIDCYTQLAKNALLKIDKLDKDYSSKLGKIAVVKQNSNHTAQ